MDNYLNDSYEYIEDDFIENDSSENSSFFPPREYLLILFLSSILLLIIIEKIFKAIFLFFIPSTFFLIITMIILNLILLRYLIITTIFIGRNSLIKFYFRSFVAKKKAKLLIQYFSNYITKLDNILNYQNIEENRRNPYQLISKSKIVEKYINIYQNIENNYGNMSSYSKNFYEHLVSLKNKIDNSPLKEIYNKIEKNEEINISDEYKRDLEIIKDEVEQIKNLLIEFRESKSLFPNLLNIKGIIYNDILQSKEFTREYCLLKKPNAKKIIINGKDDNKIDCLLIYSNKSSENRMSNSQNLIIVCGPNLIPYDNLILSWDIDTLYSNNNIDLLLWNYRGYGFSEGMADFDNICTDIVSIYDYFTNNYSYNKIGVYGFSIGGTCACHLANNRNINLLIADRTFSSTREILEQLYFGKYLAYFAKILFITFVDNTNNYLSAKCNKIMLNDIQDQIIIDPISLKSSFAKQVIYKIFNETNPENNIRNIKSYNILDYALEPGQPTQMYNSFKYTISFLKNKIQRKITENINVNERQNDQDKKERLNEDNIDIEDNNNINNNENINIKGVLDNLYEQLWYIYSNFFCPYNSFDIFLDYQCRKIHFHNFFNSLVVYGPEDLSVKNYLICSTKYTENELNNFITEIDKILNNEDNKNISENLLIQKLSHFNECLKNLKIFVAGLNMEEIENKWLKQIKGLLIPLNCGHTSFYYDDKIISTLIYLIKVSFNMNDSIAIEPPFY